MSALLAKDISFQPESIPSISERPSSLGLTRLPDHDNTPPHGCVRLTDPDALEFQPADTRPHGPTAPGDTDAARRGLKRDRVQDPVAAADLEPVEAVPVRLRTGAHRGHARVRHAARLRVLRPFHRWVDRRFVAGESDVEATPADEVGRVDGIIRKVMEENGGVASFKGVIGFSQGARLVAGLLLRQKIEERDRLGGSEWKFAFGVMIGGPFPPIAMADEVDPKDYELLRQVPTVHAWGRGDHVKPGCEELRKACESDVCFQMDFEGGHHLPLKDVEAKDLCDLINAAWFAGGGSYGISADESY